MAGSAANDVFLHHACDGAHPTKLEPLLKYIRPWDRSGKPRITRVIFGKCARLVRSAKKVPPNKNSHLRLPQDKHHPYEWERQNDYKPLTFFVVDFVG